MAGSCGMGFWMTQAEAIMDRIVHNATWMEVGDINMRERLSGRKDG